MGKILFNDGWAMKVSSGSMTDFGLYHPVAVPHDAVIGRPRSAQAPSGHASGYTTGGIFDYKKVFEVPKEWKGKQVILEFEGVYMNAEVKVNNSFVSMHPYGYSTFFVDISKYLRYGEKNKLVVRAANAAPHNSRWYTGAGIYRNVWLHTKDLLSFDPWGIQVTTPKAETAESIVCVKASGKNLYYDSQDMEVRFTVKYDNEVISTVSRSVQTGGGQSFTVEQRIRIGNALLWDLDQPELYRMEVSLLKQGRLVDSRKVMFGIRDIQFNVQDGFMLNGRQIKLKGGCIHHDHGILGAASYSRAEERKVQLMKESGYNAIRTAHNPPAPALLDACDRLGMLVMDEAFDMWRAAKGAYDYHL